MPILASVVGDLVAFYFLGSAMGLGDLAEENGRDTVWLVCMFSGSLFFLFIRKDVGKDHRHRRIHPIHSFKQFKKFFIHHVYSDHSFLDHSLRIWSSFSLLFLILQHAYESIPSYEHILFCSIS